MASAIGVFERRRLENLKLANESISRCLASHFLTGYLPGHVWYNLNEYPADRYLEPGENDEKLLAEYAANGVELIKVHEEWSDALELYGGDKYSSCDPDGWMKFIRLVHRQRMRIIPYVSSGFLDHRSKQFNPDWTATPNRLEEFHWRLSYMSPRSPGWRSFFLEQLDMILTHDGVDGIYNDLGFYPYAEAREQPRSEHVDAFPDRPAHYGALEDFLGEIQSVVRRHRGIVVNRFGGSERPPIQQKYYDYLCIGEGVKAASELRDRARGWKPFTMVVPEWSRLPEGEEARIYASCIPYLMFPVLFGGRPMTGARALCPNVQYLDDHWFGHSKLIADLRKRGAPPTYGWWDAAPGVPSLKARWFHHLKLYRRMTRDCSQVFVEISEAKFLGGKPPENVVCSAFVNEEFFLAMANYGGADARLVLSFEVEDLQSSERMKLVELPPGSLRILRKTESSTREP